MRTLLAIGFVVAISACHRNTEISELSVDQVDHMVAAGECQPVDVNNPTTRKHLGVVPGSILLTDSEDYAWSELPADKSKALVFYCGNNDCPSSHVAARRAIAEGYEHVTVMPEGIAGWVKAGKKTTTASL